MRNTKEYRDKLIEDDDELSHILDLLMAYRNENKELKTEIITLKHIFMDFKIQINEIEDM